MNTESIGKRYQRPTDFRFAISKPRFFVRQDVRRRLGKLKHVGFEFQMNRAFKPEAFGVNSVEDVGLISNEIDPENGILIMDQDTGELRKDNLSDDVKEQLIGEDTTDSKQSGSGGLSKSRVLQLANITTSKFKGNDRSAPSEGVRRFGVNRISVHAIRDFVPGKHTTNNAKALSQRVHRL